jgi:hypothetical protein
VGWFKANNGIDSEQVLIGLDVFAYLQFQRLESYRAGFVLPYLHQRTSMPLIFLC